MKCVKWKMTDGTKQLKFYNIHFATSILIECGY